MSGWDCRSCGACCATFRVSFYWAEAVLHGLPSDLVEQLTAWHACLSGTNAASPRCLALQGDVGNRVRCTVYDRRPSPCREFEAGDDRCAQARYAHRLPAIVAAAAVESSSSPLGAARP